MPRGGGDESGRGRGAQIEMQDEGIEEIFAEIQAALKPVPARKRKFRRLSSLVIVFSSSLKLSDCRLK